MAQLNFVVERYEDGRWKPKARQNFEEKDKFFAISQAPGYRILLNNEDVTERYKNPEGSISEASPTQVEMHSVPDPVETPKKESSIDQSKEKKAAMKPADYKALSVAERRQLQEKAAQLKLAKKKRSEIFQELNVTESTYDAIRADMPKEEKSSSEREVTASNSAVNKPRPGGLLGRR